MKIPKNGVKFVVLILFLLFEETKR